MSEDNTRDIAIRTATEVTQLRADMQTVLNQLSDMKTAFAERRGAERVASWVIGLGGGAVGAAVTKFGAMVFNTPMPK